MVKKNVLMLVACIIIGNSGTVFSAAGHRESITDDFTCFVCLAKESPEQSVMDLRAVVCNGPGSTLVMHANVDDVAITKKGHCLHVPCLRAWLVEKNSCPVCRREFSAVDREALGLSVKPNESVFTTDDADGDAAERFLNAVVMGNEPAVRFFLDRGMNAQVTDGIGRTALHLAVGGGFLNLVNLFLGIQGINVNAQDRFLKTTPLLRAFDNGFCNPVIVQALLVAGASPNIRGSFNNTPLHKAALGDNPDAVGMLLDAGAEIDAQNDYGNTALHNAANQGMQSVAAVLLSRGAQKNIVNSRNQTPYQVAMRRGYKDFAALLQ